MTQHDLEQKLVYMKNIIPLPENIKDEVLQSVMVLLVSVNINETLATQSYLQPLDHHESIYSFDQDEKQVIYYIGNYGKCPAAVRVVSHGFEVFGDDKTIFILNGQCFPNLSAIVSVGVAYGIKGKVQMCDVLISSQVVYYDKAMGKDQIYLPRKNPFTVAKWLKKLLLQPAVWPHDTMTTYLVNNGIPMPNVISGVILSGAPYDAGDPVMTGSNSAAEALGIEMQRAYAFTKNTVNAIIVKAVCDFTDGKNNKKYQPTATLLAADWVHICLSHYQAYKELTGLHNVFV